MTARAASTALAPESPQLEGQLINVTCGDLYTLMDLTSSVNEAARVELPPSTVSLASVMWGSPTVRQKRVD